MAFHSIIFPKLLVLSLKSTWKTLWKASKAFLFKTKHECPNKVPIVATIWLSCLLDKTQVIFWKNLRNSEIKKKNETLHHSSYLQVLNQAITILARKVLPSGIEPVPAFSLSYVRSQETFVNLCHITFPKDKRSTFKNYHSGSIFSKILQQTKRSTS